MISSYRTVLDHPTLQYQLHVEWFPASRAEIARLCSTGTDDRRRLKFGVLAGKGSKVRLVLFKSAIYRADRFQLDFLS